MYSIGVVVPYFGKKKPKFYDLWEQSAIANETIDFLVFTDIENIKSKSNIKVHQMQFSDFRRLIQQIFDFKICLDTPYKLCDYKPTYGKALMTFLKEYDFWGYSDIDLLYGDLRKYFTDNILSKVDRCYTLGHISLWRNNDRLNNVFKFQEKDIRALNYQSVYTSPESYYFDEYRGVYTKCLINNVIFSNDFPMRDPKVGEKYFYNIVKGGARQFIIVWQKMESSPVGGKLYAIEGKKKIELCYAHFFRRNFSVIKNIELLPNIQLIKVLPNTIVINEDFKDEDYEICEAPFYKEKYIIQTFLKSIKRYGVFGTFYRQIWTKKSNKYVDEIEKQYMKIIYDSSKV